MMAPGWAGLPRKGWPIHWAKVGPAGPLGPTLAQPGPTLAHRMGHEKLNDSTAVPLAQPFRGSGRKVNKTDEFRVICTDMVLFCSVCIQPADEVGPGWATPRGTR